MKDVKCVRQCVCLWSILEPVTDVKVHLHVNYSYFLLEERAHSTSGPSWILLRNKQEVLEEIRL